MLRLLQLAERRLVSAGRRAGGLAFSGLIAGGLVVLGIVFLSIAGWVALEDALGTVAAAAIVGAVCVIAGVVVLKRGERTPDLPPPPPTSAEPVRDRRQVTVADLVEAFTIGMRAGKGRTPKD